MKKLSKVLKVLGYGIVTYSILDLFGVIELMSFGFILLLVGEIVSLIKK